MEGDIREAIPDIDGNDIPIICKDALRTTIDLDGLVVDIILVPFELARRMNSSALSGVCVLVEDGDGRAMLGLDDSAGCHYGDICNLMVVNTPDIDCSIRFLDDTNVITSNASIGASVDK